MRGVRGREVGVRVVRVGGGGDKGGGGERVIAGCRTKGSRQRGGEEAEGRKLRGGS